MVNRLVSVDDTFQLPAVVAATLPTTATTVRKDDLFINVKDHGVTGNGATDDGPALRTLFAAAVDRTTYYFPNGTYAIATASSGVCLALTGRANIRIVGAGNGSEISFRGVTATDGLRIDGCRNFIMQDISVSIGNTATRTKVTNGIQFTCPVGGGAHSGKFTNVYVFNPTKAYRAIYDLNTEAGSPVITSASAAFASGDVGAGFGICQQLDVLCGVVLSTATRTGTLSAAMDATQGTLTLSAPIPNAPNTYYSIKIDNEILWVMSGFQTTSMTVLRSFGKTVSGDAAAHASGATVTTYQATVDSNMVTTSTVPYGGHLQTAAAGILENGFAVGTDHLTASMDIPQLVFIGCHSTYITGCGWRLGPGTVGATNILNLSHVSCCAAVNTVGVFMNGAVTKWEGASVGSNACDFKCGFLASQPVVISGVRSEDGGMLWDLSGANTGANIGITIRDSRIVNFHAPDGVPIRHITTQPLTLDMVTLLRDIDNYTVNIQANGISAAPLYYHARAVHTNAGNTSPHPAAGSTIVRNISAGARVANSLGLKSLHGASMDQRLTLGSALIQTRAAQTLASSGSVTIDANAGDAVITLQANAAATTITNPNADQILRVTWIQNVTGGWAYPWPANCKFAGGSAPTDTTASKRTTVTFRYDLAAATWFEVDRAVAVG